MKFLCDQMLGTCAKWLRIFGFDTFFTSSRVDDGKLIEIAKKEDRIFITRDVELSQKAKRENLKVIKLETTDLDEQLKQVLKKVKINKALLLSRCTICNELVEKIDKNKVKGKVPKRVFENNKEFFFCAKCEKYYWIGSHYDKMIEKIDELQNE